MYPFHGISTTDPTSKGISSRRTRSPRYAWLVRLWSEHQLLAPASRKRSGTAH
jgi:hypothetical protein